MAKEKMYGDYSYPFQIEEGNCPLPTLLSTDKMQRAGGESSSWGKSSSSYKTASPDRYGLLKIYARENRHNMTLAESVLWEELRAGRNGVRFLRQHIIGDYIVDFVSVSGGLIIEVDGGYHSEPRQQEDDEIRQNWLESKGYHFMRFSNEEVLNELDRVIEEIESYFS